MTQEIKLKLEQAAETAWEQDQKTNPSPVNPHAYVYGYKAGAQIILENPEEWGLVGMKASDKCWHEVSRDLYAENQRFREALEKIVNQFENFDPAPYRETVMYKIAKEALKQK